MGFRAESKGLEAMVPRRHLAAVEVGGAEHTGSSLKGLHVLLVDDEEDALDVLALILRRHGARVTATTSAAEALAAFQHHPPDVLVSDLAMPGEDGYSLIRRIRRLPAARGGKVPAIALTAFTAPDQRVNALVAGYYIHLSKPVDAVELVHVVSALGRHAHH